MNRIVNERVQESYVEETLENGLHVVLWEKKSFAKSFFLMATPLGGLDLNQIDNKGKEYTFPAGIAHFLEHKMFEKENMDVMDAFSSMGANVNAFTSYNETAYYFSTTNDPKQPLNLLLDFVQELDISKDSVEKEKGIIIQELEMYLQMSDVRLINETLSSLFENHPLKYDIGGDKESVSQITKEQLEECYRLNYHPSKMILVGVSGHDPHLLLDIIKENQNKKQFPQVSHVERMKYNELLPVYKKKHSIAMDISIPKVCLSYKLTGVEDGFLRNKKEWCFKLLFDMYFSSLNPQYQTWLDQEIINTSFSFEIDLGKDYGLLLFDSETTKIEAFKKIIYDTLNSIQSIDNKVLQRLKNRYFGLSINALEDQKQVATTYMRNFFNDIDFFAALEVIETINEADIMKALEEIDLSNECEVTITPKNV